MNKTKYPISKIRSGEVAVKLTSIEQFKKIAPEQSGVHDYVEGLYHTYLDGKLTWMAKEYTSGNECEETLIDFSQIDWEEGKEEVKEEIKPYPFYAYAIGNYRNNCTVCKNTFTGDKRALMCLECAIITAKKELSTLQSTIDKLKFQLKAADAENERLKRDMGDITRKNVELVLENETLSSKNATLAANYFESYQQLQQQQTSQSQELTLRQRMAWELYVSGFNHGIADKWTIAECYRSANIFLNYKGGDDGQ
jgi:regulator of replication initiation timing